MKKKNDKKRNQSKYIIYFSAGISILIICLTAFAVNRLISDDGNKRQKQIQMVTLLTPPPPPKVQEKPPEPEVEEKEEIQEPEPEEMEPEPMEEQASDEPPPGQDLGLDAEGGAGSDSFGLLAKKGGRALIGGSGGNGSMMRRYAWYTRILQEDLRKKVNQYMEENGGVPDGDAKAIVQIKLDEFGNILACALKGSSGDAFVDQAIRESLKIAKISEPPPNGMPRTITLKITAKG